jgi:hypothetical protein
MRKRDLPWIIIGAGLLTVGASSAAHASMTPSTYDGTSTTTTEASPQLPTVPPVKTDIITIPRGRSIDLLWTQVPGAVSYELLTNTGDLYQATGVEGLAGTIDGLTPGTDYHIEVIAHMSDGSLFTSPNSGVDVHTDGPTPVAPTVVLTAAPINQQLTNITSNSMTVSWDAPSGSNVILWQVQTKTGESWSSTGVEGSQTMITVDSLNANSSYEVRVIGFDGTNWSEVSAITASTS